MSINTRLYIENYLKIKTKESEIIPFIMNPPQLKLYNVLKQQAELGKPQRVIILKARQMGFSTETEAIIFKKTATKANVSSGIVAHKEDATTNLFNMSKLFLEELPQPLKPATRASNAQEIIFDNKEGNGLRSKIKCMTAGGSGIGRSDTYQNLHISELAFWKGDKKATLTGLLQAVPNTPDSLIIIESTANGYDYFKELWDKAVDGESDFYPLFCAWWELAEYRMDASELGELTEEEVAVQKRYNLDNEQIAWRRWCIKNNCGGDINQFKQEYPASPEEAFIASGESVFDKELIVNRIEQLRNLQEGKKGFFEYEKYIEEIKDDKGLLITAYPRIKNIKFVESESGYITIHSEPVIERDKTGEVVGKKPYVIGGDTAGLGTDYFTGKVIDNITGATVATLWKQRIDEDLYAEQMYCLGMYYHEALIGIETNYSTEPVRHLQNLGYPNLYVRERMDTLVNKIQKAVGFETNSKTRPVIIAQLVKAIREDPTIECHIPTLREMLVFVKNEQGRAEAQQGEHDDLVMARAIANFIRPQQSFSFIEKESKEEDFISKNFHEETNNSGNGGYIEW